MVRASQAPTSNEVWYPRGAFTTPCGAWLDSPKQTSGCQSIDMTLLNPPETDVEGSIRTGSQRVSRSGKPWCLGNFFAFDQRNGMSRGGGGHLASLHQIERRLGGWRQLGTDRHLIGSILRPWLHIKF
jgi:hypothetical protein